MNFLAHLYLSGDSDELRIGNFIGDFVKGNAIEDYPYKIRQGLVLHRRIDDFTDHNDIYNSSREKLRPVYGRYAGVVTDIVYDHFLAANWNEFSSISYEKYVREIYVMFVANYNTLPSKVKRILPLFILSNWLAAYKTVDGIGRVLSRMSVRTSLPDFTAEGMKILDDNYLSIGSEFKRFMPEVSAFVGGVMDEHDRENK